MAGGTHMHYPVPEAGPPGPSPGSPWIFTTRAIPKHHLSLHSPPDRACPLPWGMVSHARPSKIACL
eukprot:574988-Pyramimonas_sp.AAC.1